MGGASAAVRVDEVSGDMSFSAPSHSGPPASGLRPSSFSSSSTDFFFFNLIHSNLISPDEARDAASDAANAGEVGVKHWQDTWVRNGRLTPWQVEALNKGRRTFVYGRYKLLDYVGRGGMGSVFKGVDLKTGRLVAVKFINEEFASKTHALARFSREVELMLKLDHPNIVRAYFADLEGVEPYMAMEFVAGETVRAYIDAIGSLPADFACEVIRQAAVGMNYAHENGVVHRDLKPTNIMIAWDPHGGGPIAKVLDLGLTRLQDGTGDQRDVGLTATGQCIGTPEYIAPEQAFNSKTADGRSDVFSLGCTLFHMLTNHLPYAGRSALEQVLARADRKALRVDAFRPDLPVELVELIEKTLERDPNKRVGSLKELAEKLEAFTPGPEGLAFMQSVFNQHEQIVDPSRTWVRDPTPMPPEAPTTPEPDPGDRILQRLKSLVKSDSK
jgi:serine/threonine protein kinase